MFVSPITFANLFKKILAYLGAIWYIYICDRSNIKMSIKARWNTLAKLHSNTLKTFCSEVRGQLIPLPRKYTEIQSNIHSNTLKCPQIHSKLLAITAAALGKLFTVVFAKSQKLQTFKLNSYHMCTLQCAQYRSIGKSINYQTIHWFQYLWMIVLAKKCTPTEWVFLKANLNFATQAAIYWIELREVRNLKTFPQGAIYRVELRKVKQARKPRSYASSKLSLTYSRTGVRCRATSVAKK